MFVYQNYNLQMYLFIFYSTLFQQHDPLAGASFFYPNLCPFGPNSSLPYGVGSKRVPFPYPDAAFPPKPVLALLEVLNWPLFSKFFFIYDAIVIKLSSTHMLLFAEVSIYGML
jgi:hypothetical protein